MKNKNSESPAVLPLFIGMIITLTVFMVVVLTMKDQRNFFKALIIISTIGAIVTGEIIDRRIKRWQSMNLNN